MFASLLGALVGKKTYIALGLYLATVVANKVGIPVPAVNLDPNNFVPNLLLGLAGIFGAAKVNRLAKQ